MSEQPPNPSSTPPTAEDPTAVALSAANSALPFAELLVNRFSAMSEDLRSGNDSEALTRLSDSAQDLEDFLTYCVLISEIIAKDETKLVSEIGAYRDRLVKAVDALNPALSDLDFVEVADTLEQDVVASLVDYRSIHESIVRTLEAA